MLLPLAGEEIELVRPTESFKRHGVQEAPAMTTRKNILAAMVGLAMLAMPVRALAGDPMAIGMTGRKRGTTRAGITDGTSMRTGTITGTNRYGITRRIRTRIATKTPAVTTAVITVGVTSAPITVRASGS